MEWFEKSKLFLAGIWSMTEEKVSDFAEEMVKQGKISTEEAKKFMSEFKDKSKEKVADLQELANDKIQDSIKKMGFVQKSEITALEKKIKELEKKLKKLEQDS